MDPRRSPWIPKYPKFVLRIVVYNMYQQKSLSKVYKMVVFGSILPSIVTISGNITSVIRIIQLRRLTTVHLPARTNDDSRRGLLIFY
ncbi:unnamed protein product [Didymodactylos carnosus]|uniref:Uncharacterized protein n=1 Tax=Didymodactylos carnosus TaxID=1234261 RepID=A0A8S2U2Q7_9BILA|nr:unnamed protein product [Didymodactylos carnosus]